MKYKHIVFDIDGTLIDSEYAVLRSFYKTVAMITGKRLTIPEMQFILGIPGRAALEQMGIAEVDAALACWESFLKDYLYTESVYPGIEEVLGRLQEAGYELGIVTSKTGEGYQREFVPFGLDHYFGCVVCADDTKRHKPSGEPLSYYLERCGVKKEEVLFIGDSIYDMQCAAEAGVDGGLALWGCRSLKHIHAVCYPAQPHDILNYVTKIEEPLQGKQWLSWAMELQFIAQAGITYSRDVFDKERFERIREISAEIMEQGSGFPIEKVREVFCNETGFQTPKLDTRAAIFQDDKILLVKEKNGTWSLPGGWVDVNQTIAENTVKEAKEEAGLDVVPVRLIALHDRNRHNIPPYAYGICKAFMLCEVIGGVFEENIETVESRYFGTDELPALALEKNTPEQIRMCFDAYHNPSWIPIVD